MKLLALTRYGDLGASSRMRTFQYLPSFSASGIETSIQPLLDNEELAHRYKTGKYSSFSLLQRYFKQIGHLLFSSKSNLIWIEKELMQFVPAWFEKLLLRNRNYVLDFDDAIFHKYDRHRSGVVRAVLGRKIDRLMKNAAMVVAGNEYLASRARHAGCKRVELIPTVIDLEKYPVTEKSAATDEFVIGWIGSPTTAKYLEKLSGPLAEISKQTNMRLRVIGGDPGTMPGVNIELLPWSEAEEASMLSAIDLGVMPLDDSPSERGKCGYKLIQYMACSKPVAASPVGVNTDIVTPENGFLCETADQWIEAFQTIANTPELGRKMGAAGRKDVESTYCIQETGPKLASLLWEVFSQSNPSSDNNVH